MSYFMDALKALGITLLLLLIGGLVIGFGFLGLQAMFGPSDEQRAKDRVPAVVSSADGCTVYKFYDNSAWHYFTKCGGKGCARSRTENMTTEGNQP